MCTHMESHVNAQTQETLCMVLQHPGQGWVVMDVLADCLALDTCGRPNATEMSGGTG